MTEREALLAGILAQPEADLPRLVFVDWLAENGELGREKAIRDGLRDADTNDPVNDGGYTYTGKESDILHDFDLPHGLNPRMWQEQWSDTERYGGFSERYGDVTFSFHRGFVVRLSAPINYLIPRTCEACGGRGAFRQLDGGRIVCPICKQTGIARPPLEYLVKRHPIEFVEVLDSVDVILIQDDDGNWFITSDSLPKGIFELLVSCRSGLLQRLGPDGSFKEWDTLEQAQQALSDALLVHAKQTLTPPTPQTSSADMIS